MTTTISGGEPRFRTDIQALRGLAVVSVILFHSGLGIVPSGYLGVDVFFVVSGFLISGIIMRQRSDGRFRFQDFYLRRVRRLLPAAYTVLLATLVLAAALLTLTAFERYWSQFIGSLTFSTNVVLWKQINYFNNNAAFEPLLHMWSLAVEEQYYLVLPIILFVVPKRFWLATILLATVGSLTAYCWLYPRSPGIDFYLLPTRAWEIGIGSLAVFASASPRLAALARPAAPIAALFVLAVCFLPGDALVGYLSAVPACIAVAIVIVAAREGPRTTRLLAPVARIGNFSYSLYLVHWPLFAFAHTTYMRGELPVALSLGLIALTFVLAWGLYRYIEEPIRRSSIHPRPVWLAAIAASLALAAGCTAVRHVKRVSAPRLDLAGVTGLPIAACNGDRTAIDPRCTQSATPEMLIWGDSLSQAITPGIDASTDHTIIQASKGQCAPLLGVAPVDRDAPVAFARGCIAFNDSVLAYVAKTPSIRVVVLTGRYFRLLLPDTRAMTKAADGTMTIGAGGAAPMIADQRRTTDALHALGRRVVLISPPPQAAFDVGACWERIRDGLPTIMPGPRGAPPCAIAGDGVPSNAAEGARLMTAFATIAATPVIRLDTMMCDGATCPTAWNDTPLYRDARHLSRTGSVLIGKRFALGERAWAMAR